MKKFSHLVMAMLVPGLLVGAVSTQSVQAASGVKVVKTVKVKKVAYHATKGYIYSSAKLKHVKFHAKKYLHTTWYSLKKATVKKHGKKSTYVLVKSGKKSGWLYSRDLIKGKAPKKAKVVKNKTTVKATPTAQPTQSAPTPAPVNTALTKKQKFDNDLISLQRIIQNASTETKSSIDFGDSSDYADIAQELTYFSPDDSRDVTNETIQQNNLDRQFIVQVYQLFRGRFTASQNANLDQMSNQLASTTINSDNNKNTAQQMKNFAESLSLVINTLD